MVGVKKFQKTADGLLTESGTTFLRTLDLKKYGGLDVEL